MERRLHGLLIGVDDYPGTGPYPLLPLPGSVHDAESMASLLARRFGPRARLTLLVAPRGGERGGLRPTLEAIRRALGEVLTACGTEDQVLIYFSGHGLRLPTLRAEGEGSPFDECLVPANAAAPDSDWPQEAPVLRDLEIAGWLRRFAERAEGVVLIVDACHSGGASKEVPWAPMEHPVISRAIHAASAWLPRTPEGVVFLASAYPHQESHQQWVKGRFRGFMTACLEEIIEEMEPGSTWATVHRRLKERVHQTIGHQTPRLEGERDRLCLDWGFGASSPAEVELPGPEPERSPWSLEPVLGATSAQLLEDLLREEDLLPRASDGEAELSLRSLPGGGLAIVDRRGRRCLEWPSVPRPAVLARAFVHLARFRYVQHLEHPLSTIWRRLELSLERAQGTMRLERWGERFQPPGFEVSLAPGEVAELRIRNRGHEVLYLCLFGLQAGWVIAQVYPEDSTSFCLEGGETEGIEIEREGPDPGAPGASCSEPAAEMLAIFASTRAIELEGFELRPWDEPGGASKTTADAFRGLRRWLEASRRSRGGSDGASWDWTIERIYIETKEKR